MADEPSPQQNPDPEVKADRRRPGRVAYSNPALIRMMRGTYDAARHELEQLEHDGDKRPEMIERSGWQTPARDDLQSARGIAFAVGVGAACWVVVGGVIWVLVRIL